MAITPARTGNTISTSASFESFFLGNCTTLAVRNTGAVDVLVRIEPLHSTTGSARIPPGITEYFRLLDTQLCKAYVQGAGGTIDWYPVSVTTA